MHAVVLFHCRRLIFLGLIAHEGHRSALPLVSRLIQGQQGGDNQSMHGQYKTRSYPGQNMTAVERMNRFIVYILYVALVK